MAVLKAEAEFKLEGIEQLVKAFPDFRGGYLAYIGREARHTLKKSYLSGQEIDLRQFPRDKKGRYTVVSNVDKKRQSVKISSYPVNLFERGRLLRSGAKEAGKYIITRKLKSDVEGNIAGYGQYIENELMRRDLKKVGLT